MNRLLIFAGFFASLVGLLRADGRIESEVVVRAPIKEVWAAWTTSEGLRSWLAPLADIDLRIGGVIRANHDPKGTLGDAKTIENRVLAYEPERMLTIQVAKAPSDFPFREVVSAMWTVLYFEPIDDKQVRLRVVGLGFGSDELSKKMKDFFKVGNAYTIGQLQKRFDGSLAP